MSTLVDTIQAAFKLIRFRLAELIAEKAFRERRLISLAEVADESGVHRSTLSKMAHQPGARIATDILDKLCRYFACQPGDLMTFVDLSDDSLPMSDKDDR
jgi:putative transcriptional regulator